MEARQDDAAAVTVEHHPGAEEWPRVGFKIPPAWKRELDAIAADRAVSFADLARMIFREWLAPRLQA